MENTLRKYRAPLFGNRGSDVSAALDYVAEMSAASSDAIAISTAAYVLLNTVINAVDKMLVATSPEKLAIIELINDQIDTWAKDKLGQIMDEMLDPKITYWMDSNLQDKVSDELDTWAEDNLSERMDTWGEDNLGDKIDSWMDDNLGDKINDINLVVRVK